MPKYMNGAINPASLTKPAEYKDWKEFYEKDFAPVNKAIQAKDWPAVDAPTKRSEVSAINVTSRWSMVSSGS
jgi:hypothetical protein